jgi:hypothetical protein
VSNVFYTWIFNEIYNNFFHRKPSDSYTIVFIHFLLVFVLDGAEDGVG